MRRTPLFLSTILGVAVAAGCLNEQTSTSQEPEAQAAILGGNPTLVSCTPLPVSTGSAVIGVTGGSLNIGPHTFVVPAGALTRNVLITATTGGESVNAVHFEPEGLSFVVPASLTMSYSNCGNWGQLKRFQMVHADESYTIQEVLLTVTNSVNKSITAPLNHFSIYAVAE